MITAEHIKKLFEKHLNQIGSGEIREKVVDAFVLACRRGGWQSVEELNAIPFTLLTNTRGVDFVEHTIAVTEGSIGLARAQLDYYKSMPYGISMDRVIAGGLLHDVGKLLEFERDGKGGYRKSLSGKCARHPISGAIIASEAGLPLEIINIIACHAKEGEGRPQTVETILIHQADFATFDPLVLKEKGTLIE
jgi:putative nucleotidyltransferase with HDIG domain